MNRFNEPIDEEFEKSLLFLNQGKLIFDKSFKEAMLEFFNKHYNDPFQVHDALFNNFSLFWRNGDILLGEQVYKKILPIVHEWEVIHAPHKIHKGTPYYFYAIFSFLKDDLEKGLLLMHQAYLEDRRLGRTDTPASFFIKLNDKPQEQFFRPKVQEIVRFLESRLANYRTTHTSTFTLDDFRDIFLGQNQYEEEAIFFIYCIFKLDKILNRIENETRENRLASHIETSLIFELCKLTEVLLSKTIQPGNQNLEFANRLGSFCQDIRVHLNIRQQQRGRNNNLGFLNSERDTNFQATISGLINRNYAHPRFVPHPINIEFDIAVTYALRNFGGHKIQDQEFIYHEIEKISQSILNCIFFIIEKTF